MRIEEKQEGGVTLVEEVIPDEDHDVIVVEVEVEVIDAEAEAEVIDAEVDMTAKGLDRDHREKEEAVMKSEKKEEDKVQAKVNKKYLEVIVVANPMQKDQHRKLKSQQADLKQKKV